MSYFALQIIREANYELSYEDLWDRLVPRLEEAGYDQEPQVEGKSASKRRRLFT
jgi:hypothetical protein